METKGRLNELSQKYFGQDSVLAGVSPDASKAPVSSTTSAPESVKAGKKDPSMKDLDMEILGYTKDDTSILKKSASPSTSLATPVGAEKTDVEDEANNIIANANASSDPEVSKLQVSFTPTGKDDARLLDPNNWEYQGSGKTVEIPEQQRNDLKERIAKAGKDLSFDNVISPEEAKLIREDQDLFDAFKNAMYSTDVNVSRMAAAQGTDDRFRGDVQGMIDFVASAKDDKIGAIKKIGKGIGASFDEAANDLGTYAGDTSVSGVFKQMATVPYMVAKGAYSASGLGNVVNAAEAPSISDPNAAYDLGKKMNLIDPAITVATAGAGTAVKRTALGNRILKTTDKVVEKGKDITRNVIGSFGTTASTLLNKAGLTTARNVVDFLSNVVVKNTKNARLNESLKQAKSAFEATNSKYKSLIEVFDAEKKKPEMSTSKFKDVVENDSISKIDGSIDTAQFSSKMDDIMKNLKDKGVINKATAEKTLAAEQGRAAQFGTIEEYKADLSDRMATLRTSANKRFYDDILSTLNEKQAVAKQLSPESLKVKQDFVNTYKEFHKSATDIEAENFAKNEMKELVDSGNFVDYNNRVKAREGGDTLLNDEISRMVKDKHYTETLKKTGSEDIYGGVKDMNRKVEKTMESIKAKLINEGIYDNNIESALSKMMKGESITLSEKGLLERALSNPKVSKVLELSVQDFFTNENLQD